MITIPGNHDSRNVGYVHFEEMIGPRSTVLRKHGFTFVAVDSSEPDLDHGVVGRSRYAWIYEQFAPTRTSGVFVLHHHLLPIPGTGRERNVVYDAGDTLEVPPARRRQPGAVGPQARALRLAAGGPVRGQRGHGLLDAPARHTRPCYNVIEIRPDEVDIYRRYPFHGREPIIRFSDQTLAYEKDVPSPRRRDE